MEVHLELDGLVFFIGCDRDFFQFNQRLKVHIRGLRSLFTFLAHINTLEKVTGTGDHTSSLSSSLSSFLGVKELEAPNPPAVLGALQALAPVLPNLNPPNTGAGFCSSASFLGVVCEVNEPKILVVPWAAAFAGLDASCFTVSACVGASGLSAGASSFVDPASGVEATSSATGASLFTLDMLNMALRAGQRWEEAREREDEGRKREREVGHNGKLQKSNLSPTYIMYKGNIYSKW